MLLINAVPAGDSDETFRFAQSRSENLGLSLVDELLADFVILARGVSDEELTRLRSELGASKARADFVEEIAPDLAAKATLALA